MRGLKYSCSALVLLSSLSFVAGGLAAAPVPERKPLKPRMEVSVRPGTERVIGLSEFFLPLSQDVVAGSLIYGDARFMGDNQDATEFNLGLGYRKMVSDVPLLGDGIVGVHGWYDRRQTKRGSTFNQLTLGTEWYGDEWDVKLNGYLPLNDHEDHTQENPNGPGGGFSGTQIVVNTDQSIREEALAGLDLELGYRVPFMDTYTDSTRIYGAGFHFNGDQSNNVTGWRTRLVSDISSDFSLGLRFQTDTVRGSQSFLEATIRFPFGNKRSYQESGLWARMDESPERDIDIVSSEAVTDDGLNKPLVNASTGEAQQIVHVDNTAGGGGDGSIDNPYNTLAAAEAAAGTNDVIYVARGDGTNTGMNAGITLNDAGQKLIGAGTDLTFSMLGISVPSNASGLSSNSAIIAADAAGAPVIGNGGGDGIDVTADDVLVSGLTVDGVTTVGIDIDNANNLTISNMTISNAGSNSIDSDFTDNRSYTVNWDNITAADNVAFSQLFLTVSNATTMNFTGNDITSNNAATNGLILIGEDTSNVVANISNVTTNNAGGNGILLTVRDTSDFTAKISDSTVNNTVDSGITTQFQGNSTGSVTYENNVVNNSQDVNFRFETQANAVASITMIGNQADTTTNFMGMLVRAGNDSTITQATIQNNTVTNSADNGIVLDLFNGVTSQIQNSIVSGNTATGNVDGILFRGTAGNGSITSTVTNNTATGNTDDGIALDADADTNISVSLSGNIFTGNNNAVNVDDDSTGSITADLGGGAFGSVGNNQFFGNTGVEVFVDLDGAELKAENNWWGVGTGLAGGEVTLNSGTIDATPFLTEAP